LAAKAGRVSAPASIAPVSTVAIVVRKYRITKLHLAMQARLTLATGRITKLDDGCS